MAEFRQYKGLEGKKVDFVVFIIHGHSDARKEVKTFVEESLNFRVKVIIDEYGAGTIIEEVRNGIWDSDCAIAIMSGDDILKDNTKNARPNVMFEIGYTMGFFDNLYWEENSFNPVLLLIEEGTNIPTDLEGIKHEKFNKERGVKSSFDYIKGFLEKTFKQVKKYYKD